MWVGFQLRSLTLFCFQELKNDKASSEIFLVSTYFSSEYAHLYPPAVFWYP